MGVTEVKSNGWLECPFCGCAMRVESNRDWHHLMGDHDEDVCVFESAEATLTVPATAEGMEWMKEAWNERTSNDHVHPRETNEGEL